MYTDYVREVDAIIHCGLKRKITIKTFEMHNCLLKQWGMNRIGTMVQCKMKKIFVGMLECRK